MFALRTKFGDMLRRLQINNTKNPTYKSKSQGMQVYQVILIVDEHMRFHRKDRKCKQVICVHTRDITSKKRKYLKCFAVHMRRTT